MTRPASERQVLGKRLRELREAADLRAVDVAALLGLDQSSVTRIESGERKITDSALSTWLQATQASPEVAAELSALAARAAADQARPKRTVTAKTTPAGAAISPEHQHLGQRLRKLRTDAGLRAKQVAAQLGLHQSTVSRIETGKRTISGPALKTWLGVTHASQDLAASLVAAHAALPPKPAP